MKMEKYGFVYIWYDRRRKMFYIGCRFGTEDDGYICSSNRMRDAYRRRPQDFKRRILSRGITRENLLDEEHKWLSLIPDNDLGKRYYNLRKHKWGHWSTDENSRLTVGQKISASPNRAKNIGLANKGRKPAKHTTEATIKAHKGLTYEEIYGAEKAKEVREKQRLNRKSAVWTEEMRQAAGERSKKHMLGRKASDETKKKMSETHKTRYMKAKKNDDKKYL